FERQKGGIDQIRQQLGLRPSQICELLKVHPSAWTRWVRTNRVPPHVYQMLDWYIEILKWRGQFHGPEKGSVLEVLRKEDPNTYVPPTEVPIKSLSRSSALELLVASCGMQLVLWG